MWISASRFASVAATTTVSGGGQLDRVGSRRRRCRTARADRRSTTNRAAGRARARTRALRRRRGCGTASRAACGPRSSPRGRRWPCMSSGGASCRGRSCRSDVPVVELDRLHAVVVADVVEREHAACRRRERLRLHVAGQLQVVQQACPCSCRRRRTSVVGAALAAVARFAIGERDPAPLGRDRGDREAHASPAATLGHLAGLRVEANQAVGAVGRSGRTENTDGAVERGDRVGLQPDRRRMRRSRTAPTPVVERGEEQRTRPAARIATFTVRSRRVLRGRAASGRERRAPATASTE